MQMPTSPSLKPMAKRHRPIATACFRLMMDRLSDLQHDIAAHEFSERPMLLGIALEKHMQVWFAKRLQGAEWRAYRVDSEALVINDKGDGHPPSVCPFERAGRDRN
jgi:hypothetical protein